MKKLLTCIVVIVMVAAIGVAMVACNPGEDNYVQGVDTENHVITVGNTAVTTGAYAAIGAPFIYAQQAYFWNYYNNTDGYVDAAGNKYQIKLQHYDDKAEGETGLAYTQKLVEEDKVFALVGHFGATTVGATAEYIEEKGVPMVYAACGISELYDSERNIMGVQPIYETEGAHFLATAFAPVNFDAATGMGVGLGATKVGVIVTTDESGQAQLRGIRAEAAKLGKVEGTDFIVQEVALTATENNAQVAALKAAGCDVLVAAGYFSTIMTSMQAVDYNVPVITSYVNANTVVMTGLAADQILTDQRPVYAHGWLETGTLPNPGFKGWDDFVEFVRIMTAYDKSVGANLLTAADPTYGIFVSLYFGDKEWAVDGVSAYFLNSYAMAGYVSADVFCQGLTRMSGKDLTWAAFIDAMESAPLNLPMGKEISFVDGNRKGVEILALSVYSGSVPTGVPYRHLTSLAEIEAVIQ